jgi:2-methylcitrate dehydratase PrpD
MSSSQPPLLPNATRDLARFAAETPDRAIPAAVLERVKLSFLDGLGVCLRGATLPWTRMVRELVQAEGGNAVASLWGAAAESRTSLTNAVLVNSTAGHAFEMDDIHTESILHPNSLGVPVALALAEADPALTGRAIAAALTLGYEVGLRIGNAATTALFLNGFHPQGTTGAFIAAATAGRLLHLDAAQMQHALGITGSMGAGLMAAQEGAMVKRLHAGRAAQSGLLAALLAGRGFTGIADVVEAGYGGFLATLSRTPDVARLMAGLGADWEAGKIGFKMYPNVTSIHAALDGLKAILVEERVPAAQIEKIRVGCGHMTFVHTAWDYRPAGTTAAQMNMFFGLAVMAQRQDVTGTPRSPTAKFSPSCRGSRSRSIPRSRRGAPPFVTPRGSRSRPPMAGALPARSGTGAVRLRIRSAGRRSSRNSPPMCAGSSHRTRPGACNRSPRALMSWRMRRRSLPSWHRRARTGPVRDGRWARRYAAPFGLRCASRRRAISARRS